MTVIARTSLGAAVEAANSAPTYGGWCYVALIVYAALIILLGWRSTGPDGRRFNFLYGEDGRQSTSKLASYAWLVSIVAGAGMLLVAVATQSNVTLESSNLKTLDEQYLILMGASLGTLVLSKGIVSSKINAKRLQKPAPGTVHGFEQGGFTGDDKGSPDLVDIQYLGFNAVLLVYFLGSVLTKAIVPELPATLVGLTGASAAAYVTNKALQANPPTIDAVTVATAGAGITVQVRGHYLYKPSDEDAATMRRRIGIHGVNVTHVAKWSEDASMIDVTVDAQPQANAPVTVTTAAGATVSGKIP